MVSTAKTVDEFLAMLADDDRAVFKQICALFLR